jgi:uncharacterized protein Usg
MCMIIIYGAVTGPIMCSMSSYEKILQFTIRSQIVINNLFPSYFKFLNLNYLP